MKALLGADQLGRQEEVGRGEDLLEAEPEVGVAVSPAQEVGSLLSPPKLILGVQEPDHLSPRGPHCLPLLHRYVGNSWPHLLRNCATYFPRFCFTFRIICTWFTCWLTSPLDLPLGHPS
jgi:hypothetical protein